MSKITIDDIKEACEKSHPVTIGPYVLERVNAHVQPCGEKDIRSNKTLAVITIHTWLDKTEGELYENRLELENQNRLNPFFSWEF